MGSDQSKSRDSYYNSNLNARRHYVHPQSPPTRTAPPSSSYQQTQNRPETLQREPVRVRQTYNYAQNDLPTNVPTTSLYPRLNTTTLNHQKAQVTRQELTSQTSYAAANRNENTASATQNTSSAAVVEQNRCPSPAAKITGKSSPATAPTTRNTAATSPFAAGNSSAVTVAQRTENTAITQRNQSVSSDANNTRSPATAQTTGNIAAANPFAAQTTGNSSEVTVGQKTEDIVVTQRNQSAVVSQNSGYISSASAQITETTAAANPFVAQKAEYTAPMVQRVASPARRPYTFAQSAAHTPKPANLCDESFVFVNMANSVPKAVNSSYPSPTAPMNLKTNHTGAVKKQRSRSKAKVATAAATELNINCPTCNEQYTENIFQCGEGHSACETCKQSGVRCRLCRLPITDMRNFSLQEYVCEIKTPCYNASEGCMYNIKIGDMAQHLRDCPFQELDCPLKAVYGLCNWRGKLSQLAGHFDANHPENRQGNIDQELFLPNIYYDEKYVHFVEIGCYRFLVHLRVSEAQRCVYMAVQLIGTMNNASKWTYDIHVYNKREPRRKYQFSDSCHPIGTSTEQIFNEAKCAVLPQPLAVSFINEGALTYKFYIKKDFEAKREFVAPRRNNNRKKL